MKKLMIIAMMSFGMNAVAQYNMSSQEVTARLYELNYYVVVVSNLQTTIKIEKGIRIKYVFEKDSCVKLVVYRKRNATKVLTKWLVSQNFEKQLDTFRRDDQIALLKKDVTDQSYVEITMLTNN